MYISLKFTWFYQAVKAVMFFFVLYVTYTYGHLQLGRTTDTPEFGTVTYFCLVFAASVGSALLASGVSDPLYQREGNFFANAGYRSQDEKVREPFCVVVPLCKERANPHACFDSDDPLYPSL
jgi:choline-glycine betaine transporter